MDTDHTTNFDPTRSTTEDGDADSVSRSTGLLPLMFSLPGRLSASFVKIPPVWKGFGFCFLLFVSGISLILKEELWGVSLRELGAILAFFAVLHVLQHYVLIGDLKRTLDDTIARALDTSKSTVLNGVLRTDGPLHNSHITAIHSVTAVAQNGIARIAEAAADCLKIGIERIHPEDIKPFDESLNLKSGDRVTCIGRTLCDLFKVRRELIEQYMQSGVHFEFATCNYEYCLSPHIKRLTWAKTQDFDTMFNELISIESKCRHNCPGSLTLYFHDIYLPDTVFAIERHNEQSLEVFWIPYFGRHPHDKVTFVLTPLERSSENRGNSSTTRRLFDRFLHVLDAIEEQDAVADAALDEGGSAPTHRQPPVYWLPEDQNGRPKAQIWQSASALKNTFANFRDGKKSPRRGTKRRE